MNERLFKHAYWYALASIRNFGRWMAYENAFMIVLLTGLIITWAGGTWLRDARRRGGEVQGQVLEIHAARSLMRTGQVIAMLAVVYRLIVGLMVAMGRLHG